jgi:acyl carrier protein
VTERAPFDRLAEVVHVTFPAADDVVVTRETTSADIDGWDSLSYSILIMNVEEAFSIELPVERIYDLENVGALLALIEATSGQTPPS